MDPASARRYSFCNSATPRSVESRPTGAIRRNGIAVNISGMKRSTTLAGAGAIAFGVLTVVGFLGGTPGGNYDESTVADYISGGHFPMVIATGYLAIVGVVGLICLLAYLRELSGADQGRQRGANIAWGI